MYWAAYAHSEVLKDSDRKVLPIGQACLTNWPTYSHYKKDKKEARENLPAKNPSKPLPVSFSLLPLQAKHGHGGVLPFRRMLTCEKGNG